MPHLRLPALRAGNKINHTWIGLSVVYSKRDAPFEDWVNVSTGNSFTRWVEPDLKRMSGPWRVWELCLGRMNNWGHAAFDPGELAELATGRDTPSGRQMIARWLKTLADMRRVKPPSEPGGSTQLCVIVSCDLAWRGAGRASDYYCSEPSHRQSRKQTWPEQEQEPSNPPAHESTDPVRTDDPWADESTPQDARDTPRGGLNRGVRALSA